MNGYHEFEFDLPGALLANLVETFSKVAASVLSTQAVATIPDEQGVYQIILDDQIVYIGKTDGEAGLRNRLTRHSYSIQHRANLDPARVLFKAIRVFVFTAVDLETQLIKHYAKDKSVAWNNRGFGSNDPGRNREDTKLDPTSFDAMYPIDIDRPIALRAVPANLSAAAALATIRAALPYTFRHEMAAPKSKSPHPDLANATVNIDAGDTTCRKCLATVLAALPPGWQATRLAGRVILYREHRDYDAGEIIGRSTGTVS